MVKNVNEVLYGNETINLKSITLRKFAANDYRDLYEYASDPQTLEYLVWDGLNSLQEAKDSIYNYYWSRPGIYAIEHNESKKCIGAIDIRPDLEHEKTSFGYVLNRSYWGRGYMSEALAAIIRLCFEKLELNRVEGYHFIGNEASGRVMAKCGMSLEGIMVQEMKVKGEFRDCAHYAITKCQWELLSQK
ncbi:MAG: GNAT family N-acetyltransferase [Eubacteriaceae bacterium]|nr:GNAT family N-acetyltransferase [Eubacteriaceae bacterium]